MRNRRWLLSLLLAWSCRGDDGVDPPDSEAVRQICPTSAGPGGVLLGGSQQFDNLQRALDAAEPGDELLLCPGTYEGNFLASVPVRIVAVEDHTVTVLTGLSDFAPTLTLPGGSEIVGLTVRSGGGGVVLSSPGTLRIEASRITGNRAEHGAGLVVAEDSLVTLVGSEITDNVAGTGGGGVWVRPGSTLELTEGSFVSFNRAGEFGGGVWLQDAHLVGGVVSDNVLVWSHDSAPRKDPESGEVLVEGEAFGGSGVALSGTGSVTDTEIAWNTGQGGGLSLCRGTGTFADVWVHHNDALTLTPGAGGGLGVALGAAVHEGNTRFEHNTARFGGGAWVLGGSIAGGSFAANHADGDGGGGAVTDGTVTGARFTDNTSSAAAGGLSLSNGDLVDVVLRGNTSQTSGGGLATRGRVRLERVHVEGNRAELGGGIFMTAHQQPSTSEIVDSAIAGNDALNGGGVYVWSHWWVPLTLEVTSSTIAGNTAAQRGGGLWTDGAVHVSGGAITANTAASGGGAYVDTAGSLAITGTDLGVEQGENTPDDVATPSAAYVGYGANASLTCDGAACAPSP